MQQRYFTPEEANALLPSLRALIERMWQARDAVLAVQPELAAVLQKAASNGGSGVASQALAEFRRLQEAMQTIRELGCELKDLDQGLIDFRSRRNGREIYLCWRYGEERVAFWHDLEAGFAGRQPL